MIKFFEDLGEVFSISGLGALCRVVGDVEFWKGGDLELRVFVEVMGSILLI